jgi:hypothetical protein
MIARALACLLLTIAGCGDDLVPPHHAGACRAHECAPYACGPGDTCLRSCSTAGQCAPDHVCEAGACLGTECTPETALEVCGPYACVAGDCATDCAIAPCAEGFYCRGNDSECFPNCTEENDPLCEGYICNLEVGECEQICGHGIPCAEGFTCDPDEQCHPSARRPMLAR